MPLLYNVFTLQITRQTKNPQLLDILKTLAELRESYNFACNAGVEYAVGAAIKALGPRIVLQTLPLQVSYNRFNKIEF